MGAAGGSLAQLGNQSIGQSIGYGISAQLASDDWDRWKDSLTRGPTYRMQGLANAGLNPILAVQGGLGVGTPQLPSSKPSGSGGPGTNPALAQAQINAARAATAKLVAEEKGVGFRNIIDEQNASFWNSPLGRQTIIDRERNNALPNTVPAAGIRLLDMLRDGSPSRARDVKAQPRPKQFFIEPRGRQDPQMGLP